MTQSIHGHQVTLEDGQRHRRPIWVLLAATGQQTLLRLEGPLSMGSKWDGLFAWERSNLRSRKKDDLVQCLLDGCIDYESRKSLVRSIMEGQTNQQIRSFWDRYRAGLSWQDQRVVGALSSWGTNKAAYIDAICRVDEQYTKPGLARGVCEPEPGAEERAASYERARPSSAREGGPRDCDQAQATETAVVQYDAHKHIWWANLGKFFQTSRKKRRDTKKKEKKQRKIKATRKDRAASVRAAIKAELNTATCDKATLRARVSDQVGFSLEAKFWRYVFEKKLQKEILAQRVKKRPRCRFKLGFSKAAPKKKRQPQATASVQRRARARARS